ncbi:caspase domain-containing protein [Lactarius quietus]|nr:caspase domain-containing protein [Lactarius quietus]
MHRLRIDGLTLKFDIACRTPITHTAASPRTGPHRFYKSSGASAPRHKALLIGINYTSSTDDNEQGYRQLKGPVNDAKEVKEALIELFNYKGEDINLMTDEEENNNTARWPSRSEYCESWLRIRLYMKALSDLVRNASPGDAFVFFYAGHSGQQPVTNDPNEVDGLDEYIVTRDFKIILDNTLRECLVDPLPKGARLTAILDSCHSGTLLDLDHYSCHWFLRRRSQSLHEQRVVTRHDCHPRRHTHDVWEFKLVRSATQLFRTTFSGTVTAALAIVRFRIRLAKKKKQGADSDDSDDSDTTLVSPGCVPRPPCGGWYCAYALLNGPLVISVSSCSDEEATWEDSQNKGKSMTTKLIQILRKNPSVKVGELNQQLKKKLSKMAFKRVLNARKALKRYTAKLPPEEQKKLEDKYTEKGTSPPSPLLSQYIAYDGTDRELAPLVSSPFHAKMQS